MPALMIPSIGMHSGYIANVLNGMHSRYIANVLSGVLSILHLHGTGNVTGFHCYL